MNNEQHRYSGQPTWLRLYWDEFLVECPRCTSLAIVSSGHEHDTSYPKLVCTECDLLVRYQDLTRYDARVLSYCIACDEMIYVEIPNNKEIVNELTLSCHHCGVASTYYPTNVTHRLKYKNSNKGINDPVFNLPLWLQTEVKGEVFWAYNRKHLSDIRDYVAAKLRERIPSEFSTMVERLPTFIKSAKNRTAILKAIEKMMKR